MVGQKEESLHGNFLLIKGHDFVKSGAEFGMDFNIEDVFVDFMSLLPNNRWGDFFLQFFFDVFGERFFLRKLYKCKATGLMYMVTNFLVTMSIERYAL